MTGSQRGGGDGGADATCADDEDEHARQITARHRTARRPRSARPRGRAGRRSLRRRRPRRGRDRRCAVRPGRHGVSRGHLAALLARPRRVRDRDRPPVDQLAGRRGEDHPTRSLGDDVARRLPHERVAQAALAAQQRAAAHAGRLLGGEHDRLDAPSPRLVHDRLAGAAGAHGRGRDLDVLVLLADGLRAGERGARALELGLRHARVDRQRHRDLEHPQRLDHRAALVEVLSLVGGQSPCGLHDVVVERSAEDRHEDRAVLDPRLAVGERALGDRHALEDRLARDQAIAEVERQAEGHPGDADDPRPAVERQDRHEGEGRQRRAHGGRDRQLGAAHAHVERHAIGPVAVGLAPAQPDHREVHERERQRRAERVDPTEELEVAGDHERDRQQRADPDDHHRRGVAGVQTAEQRRDLAVERERVAQPREPEHGRVARHDEHRERRQAHQVTQRLAQPLLVEARHDGEHRRLDGLLLARVRRQDARRDERDAHVGHGGGGHARGDQALEAATRDMDLTGQARGGVEAGERDQRERQRERQVLGRRDAGHARRVGQHVGVEQQREAEHHEDELQPEVGEHDERRAVVAARPRAAQVGERDVGDHADGEQRLRQAARQAPPEHREVVRGRERADRDQDQVVEQDRPARDEAEQLVEGVAGEDRRPTALLVQRGALDVGEHEQREEQRRDEHHGPGQRVGALDDQADGEVDRGGREALGDAEEGRRAEPALEALVRLEGRQAPAHLIARGLHRRPSIHSRPAPAATNSRPMMIP